MPAKKQNKIKNTSYFRDSWIPINSICLKNNFIKYGNAVNHSPHLKGEAIDILVLDVNNDGKLNETDVDLVYKILDEKSIKLYIAVTQMLAFMQYG